MKLRRVRLPCVSVMVDIVFPSRKMSTKPDQAQLTDAARRARLATAARAYANRRRWDRSLAPLFETYRDVHAAHVGAPLPRPVPDSHGRQV